jgi:S-adenosylmethionine decarboxylase
MQGLHLTADLHGCSPELAVMTQSEALRRLCLAAVHAVGLHAVGELFHRFAPLPGQCAAPGITGMVLLAESHLAIHTWPELGAVTLDVYVCNFGADNRTRAQQLMAQLCAAFEADLAQQQQFERGLVANP